jgi:hypothetical protein
MFAANFLIGFLVLLNVNGSPTSAPSDFQPSFANTSLVEADVTSISPLSGNVSLITLKITDVFAGSVASIGDTFTCVSDSSARSIIRDNIDSMSPIPKSGEKSLWLMHLNKGKLALVDWGDWMPYFPARAGVSPRFAQSREVANAIKIYQKMNDQDRLKYLNEQTLAGTPEVCDWAVNAMATDYRADLKDYLIDVSAPEQLPLATQIALDRQLSLLEGEAWLDSLQRREIFSNLKNASPNEYEQTLIEMRLVTLLQHPGESDPVLIPTCVDLATKHNLGERSRCHIVREIGLLADREYPGALEALDVIQSSSDSNAVRAEANYWLGRGSIPSSSNP